MTRQEARASILAAANKNRRDRNNRGIGRVGFLAPPLYARHLQMAVCIVRRQGLVGPAVLLRAGFRAEA